MQIVYVYYCVLGCIAVWSSTYMIATQTPISRNRKRARAAGMNSSRKHNNKHKVNGETAQKLGYVRMQDMHMRMHMLHRRKEGAREKKRITLMHVLATFETYNIFIDHLVTEFSIEVCCVLSL